MVMRNISHSESLSQLIKFSLLSLCYCIIILLWLYSSSLTKFGDPYDWCKTTGCKGLKIHATQNQIPCDAFLCWAKFFSNITITLDDCLGKPWTDVTINDLQCHGKDMQQHWYSIGDNLNEWLNFNNQNVGY